MMLMNPDKKIASIIVAKMGKKGEESSELKEPKEAKESDVALDGAMEDFMAALSKKDASAAAAALKAFMYLCEGDEESAESEME